MSHHPAPPPDSALPAPAAAATPSARAGEGPSGPQHEERPPAPPGPPAPAGGLGPLLAGCAAPGVAFPAGRAAGPQAAASPGAAAGGTAPGPAGSAPAGPGPAGSAPAGPASAGPGPAGSTSAGSAPAGGAPAGGGPRRGRPRAQGVEEAIFEAAVGLLEKGVPLAELSIEKIARTAGVGKATIYRRWAGKEDLFVDLLRSVEPPDPVLPGVSVRDDLVALMESIRQRGLAKRNSALLHNVFSQMQLYPKLWDAYHHTVIEPRRRLGIDVVRRGMELGEIRDDLDVELVNDLFTGPLLLRSIIRPGATLEPGLAEQVVDAVLEGLRPRD
ncbi:TetR/AcrR family transcriptional regulator [Streptomyces sp. NPDC053493]|uniref:TetR/AcrR family transcriptional regulator n=1 Tax=Streptomyces sp. NPDC053493 TaxID=3365705 RepID=UPI0037CDA00D